MTFGRKTVAGLTIAAVLSFVAAAVGDPVSVDAAAAALHAGNASNAVALATQALADTSLTPRDRARVLVDRGLAHEMLGERDAALLDLTEAVNAQALLPAEMARAFYDRGVTLDELNRTEDAAGDYSAAIRIEPKFAAALNNRGNAYRRIGRLAEARADYQASIAAGNPHPEYPNYGLGQVAETAGQTEEARAYYRAALAANPQFALASERLSSIGNVQPPAAPILLKPPGGSAPPTDARSDTDGEVHLRPPAQSVVHLHPPGTPRRPADTSLDLKPALNENGGTGGGQTVQLGAWRSQGDAANAWSRIATASGNLMAGLSPQVVPVDLPGRGRFYRLRAGPVPPGTAAALCAALSARRHACIVVQD